jgi:signal transduction histidine kinase
MALRLKTKFTLAMALLVLAVAVVISGVYLATMTREAIAETRDRARTAAQQVFLQAQHALNDATANGSAPASDSPADLREYVRKTLAEDAGLASQISAVIGYSKTIYEVSIVDRDGVVLVSSDTSLPGLAAPRRPGFEQLQEVELAEQFSSLYGPPRVYEVRLPFNIGDEAFGEVRVGLSTVFLRAEMNRRFRTLALLALGAVLISTLLAAVVSTISLAPLSRISAQLDRVAAGEGEVQPITRGDELGQVSRKISALARQMQESKKGFATREEEQLDRIAQMKVAERLAARARLTANVAHEVKNPLNSMRLWLENLRSAAPQGDESAQQALRVLDTEIDRLDGVVKRLLEFHRPAELHFEATSAVELLESTLLIAQPKLQSSGISLVRDWNGELPPVRVDRPQMQQAILNLLLNAVEAMPDGGTLKLALARRGEWAEISIADTGCGIPAELQPKVFQLFFTTRPGGNGLGLATAARIVQDHNGSIDFTSEAGRGTTFRIELPLAGAAR